MKTAIVFNPDGTAVAGPIRKANFGPVFEAGIARDYPGCLLYILDGEPPSYDRNRLRATIEDGQVTSVQAAPEPPTLWVHVSLTGGVQSPAGTLYLKNDGVDALQVHAELRDGPDAATSNAVTQIGGQDVTGLWALELVNVDTGALADAPLAQMTAGVIDMNYTTTIAPCEVELAEDRLQMIGPYRLKLASPLRFKVVRALD